MKAAALLALLCCVPPAAAAAQRVDPNLRLPPGWDDAYFERLAQGQNPRAVVAVMEFGGGELLAEHLRFNMSDMLITDLVQAGRFVVVERSRIDAIRQELAFQESGMVDPATAAEVGRMLGAELVVFGLVTRATEQTNDKFSYDEVVVEVAVDIRAVNASSGRVVISETAAASATARIITTADGTIISGPTDYDPLYVQATAAALDSVAIHVSTAAPLIGFVIAIRDNGVLLDVGAGRGVNAGDTFVVFRRGEQLVHPVTGATIGWEKSVLGQLAITSTEEDLSTAELVAVTEEGVALQPGDLVIYRAPQR